MKYHNFSFFYNPKKVLLKLDFKAKLQLFLNNLEALIRNIRKIFALSFYCFQNVVCICENDLVILTV